jgi:hypothetical protein
MRVHGSIPEERTAGLAEAAALRTLEGIVRWGAPRGVEVTDILVQDEFTHDVVVPLPDGLVLVYGTT